MSKEVKVQSSRYHMYILSMSRDVGRNGKEFVDSGQKVNCQDLKGNVKASSLNS